MPTHEEADSFWHDWVKLTEEQQDAFLAAVDKMVDDLKAGRGLRAGLRVKVVQDHLHIFEMTWAGDGRATFAYGRPVHPGDVHIVWRRIGSHDILKHP